MLLISAATLGLLATMTQPSRLRPRSRYPLFIAAALLTLGLAGLAAAIAWGGPHDIPPLSSINNPFKGVDYGGVPPVQRYTARDGTSLAWHGYSPSPATAATPQRRVVLVHGSSARGQSNHVLAQALAAGLRCVLRAARGRTCSTAMCCFRLFCTTTPPHRGLTAAAGCRWACPAWLPSRCSIRSASPVLN